MGSARTVYAMSLADCYIPTDIPSKFSVIIDSGCTTNMFPYQGCFINYKKLSKSYVVLADNTRSPCFGNGDVKIILGGVTVILANCLHVPSLRCPLLSVRCHRRQPGCSFVADNTGAFLTFPEFIIKVDDSVDCFIKGSPASDSDTIYFDGRSAGLISAVSEGTRHRAKRRAPVAIKRKLACPDLEPVVFPVVSGIISNPDVTNNLDDLVPELCNIHRDDASDDENESDDEDENDDDEVYAFEVSWISIM